MRPAPSHGRRLCGLGLAALCLQLAGCGQTGYLYLVWKPTNFPPITRTPVPALSTAVLPEAPCVVVHTPTANVAPVDAPFPATSVADVPYAPETPPTATTETAPASLTDILPPCVVYPADYRSAQKQARRGKAATAVTRAAPAAATTPGAQP